MRLRIYWLITPIFMILILFNGGFSYANDQETVCKIHKNNKLLQKSCDDGFFFPVREIFDLLSTINHYLYKYKLKNERFKVIDIYLKLEEARKKRITIALILNKCLGDAHSHKNRAKFRACIEIAKSHHEKLGNKLNQPVHHYTGLADFENQLIARATKWAAPLGLKAPNKDEFYLNLEVARRRKITYALFLKKCLDRARLKMSTDAFTSCIDYEKKIHRRLGNKLDQPARYP